MKKKTKDGTSRGKGETNGPTDGEEKFVLCYWEEKETKPRSKGGKT